MPSFVYHHLSTSVCITPYLFLYICPPLYILLLLSNSLCICQLPYLCPPLCVYIHISFSVFTLQFTVYPPYTQLYSFISMYLPPCIYFCVSTSICWCTSECYLFIQQKYKMQRPCRSQVPVFYPKYELRRVSVYPSSYIPHSFVCTPLLYM